LNITLNPGKYIITAEDRNGLKISNNITVLPTIIGNDIIKYFRNGTQYVVKVLDDQGNPLAGSVVRMNVHGVLYEKTSDANGIAILNITLNPGKYIITAEDRNGLNITNNITVLPTIMGNDIVKYFRNGTQYVVEVLDGHGNRLAGSVVRMNINGVFYNATSDVNGIATLNINLNPGNYLITAEDTNGLNVSNNISVLPKLTGQDLITLFRSEEYYEVKLVDDIGKVAPNKKITINIHGVFYEVTTDSNGIGRLEINLNPGSYIATAYHDTSSVSNNIIVN
jgi:translation initiation factor 6 (eIF-6)